MLTKRDVKYIKKTITVQGEDINIIIRPKGLGDSFEHFLHTGLMGKITHTITGYDKPCEPCKARRDTLNNILPYEK